LSQQDSFGKGGLRMRLLIIGAIAFSVFLFLVLYLFNLQIVEKLLWEGRAKAVSSRSEPLSAQRGLIWDRNFDTPLAVNIDSFAVHIIPAEISPSTPQELAALLAPILDMEAHEIVEELPADWINAWNPVEIKDGVSFETVIQLAESNEKYPGVAWSSKPYRWYNDVGSISHILGYVGDITVEELQLLYNEGYGNTSSLGKGGVEKAFDDTLRGRDGIQFRTVDAKGRKLGEVQEIVPPSNGFDIVLTIDRHIQELAEKALGPRKGSVVVLKPATGEILALVSYPSFNPNHFFNEGPGNFRDLSLNTDFPFLNRSIQSSYAPASTFKLVVAAAILGENVISPKQAVNCQGAMSLGNREFWCHKKSGHGWVNLKDALVHSCNIYFGSVAVEHLGIDIISQYAKAFGLGTSTGIALDGEVEGNVPDRNWKQELYHTRWTGGDTLNVSVGQGFLTATPLQLANVVAGIANNGIIHRPRLLKEIRSTESKALIEQRKTEVLRRIDLLDAEDWRFIQSAMRTVVTQGTAFWVIHTDSVDIAGKTGTGEVGILDGWHDWFVAYGPYKAKNPEDQVVVVTMLEASDTYNWWAPKAADIIFEGIFAKRSYEQVIEEWRRKRVWWSWDNLPLPPPGMPYVPPVEQAVRR